MSENVNTRLVIDPVTRTITPKYRNQKAVYVAKGDHNSVLICFEMPRYVDGYDMSAEENAIQIHYANMDGKDERKVSKGFSDAINITAEKNEVKNEAVVSFCWLVPKTATRYAGVVSIGITFERYDNVDGKAQEVYSWSTAPYGKTIVWDSLDNSAEVVEREYNYLVDTCNAIVALAMENKISEVEQIIDKKISNANNEIDKAVVESKNQMQVVVAEAKKYADKAEEHEHNASEHVAKTENMTVSAETLEASEPAFVQKTVDDVVNLHFGLPKGDTGEKGDKGDKGDKGEKGDTGDITNVSFLSMRLEENGDLYYTVEQVFDGDEVAW